MPGRFNCVGFDFQSLNDFTDVVQRLLTEDSADLGTEGARLRWTDAGSGARLLAYALPDRTLDCFKPSFENPRELQVRWRGTVPDPAGCRFCVRAEVDVLHGGSAAYSLLVELEESHDPPRFPVAGDLLRMRVAAFAEHLRAWRDVQAYAASQRSGPPLRSVLAMPRLRDAEVQPPPSAEAIITGVVTRRERRTNAFSGLPFDMVTLDTQGGAFDVLAPAIEGDLEPGNVIQGGFWLIAQLPAVC